MEPRPRWVRGGAQEDRKFVKIVGRSVADCIRVPRPLLLTAYRSHHDVVEQSRAPEVAYTDAKVTQHRQASRTVSDVNHARRCLDGSSERRRDNEPRADVDFMIPPPLLASDDEGNAPVAAALELRLDRRQSLLVVDLDLKA